MQYIYLLFAVFFYLLFYKLNKDVFQPCGVFLFMWFLGCFISNLDVKTFMLPWSLEMHLVCVLSGLSFFIGTIPFLTRKKKNIQVKIELSTAYSFLLYSLFFISFFCFIIEWKLSGFHFSITNLDQGGDAKHEALIGIPGVHYGTFMMPFISVFAMFKLLNDKRKSYLAIFIILFSIFVYSLAVGISRGDMMIYCFSFLFLISRYKKISLRSFLIFVLLLSLILIGGMMLRVSNDSSIVYTTTTNPYFSVIYSYIATCYANLNELIINDYSCHLLGDASLAPLWTILGMKENLFVISIEQLDVFNARTYLYGFYHDYKLIGIVLFPMLIGSTISFCYQKYIKGGVYYILLLAIMQKAIYVSFFGNYFFGDLVDVFPYIVTLFFLFFSIRYKVIITK